MGAYMYLSPYSIMFIHYVSIFTISIFYHFIIATLGKVKIVATISMATASLSHVIQECNL